LSIITTSTRRDLSTGKLSKVEMRVAHLLDLLLNTNFLFLKPICWKRAPVLHRYLALNGIETRVVFGVRREGEMLLSGHAWLESGGVPVLETHVPEYIVTYIFPQ